MVVIISIPESYNLEIEILEAFEIKKTSLNALWQKSHKLLKFIVTDIYTHGTYSYNFTSAWYYISYHVFSALITNRLNCSSSMLQLF